MLAYSLAVQKTFMVGLLNCKFLSSCEIGQMVEKAGASEPVSATYYVT